ncbi:zinc-binding dehydrogenase [Microlunatus flavus]|uniref:NADPH:quinone reductase n=1 Tax=Microlunatus flavus TaxID=1036181 RepID=A0A1H9CHH7_9ACTN|nr:zinc-binding dehydrogenase [Microlunatus flavus]SEQ00078.1 NADPH:quinone reductase [Microlunatus flavus]
MRAVQVQRFGDPSGMEVVEVPEPEPQEGQLLVHVEAIGVAGVDAVIRRRTIGGGGFAPGFVPGREVAGTVREVGPGVDRAWIGRRVWAFTGDAGGYLELALAAVEDAVVLPDGLGAVEAVTLGSAVPVARFALAHGHLAPGESVLVRGAAGSLGIAAVELAARAGAAAVAVTTSSAERGDRLRELGATHVLDRRGEGDGPAAYDVVVDVVGGPDLPAFLDRLAPNGRHVLVGVVAGMPPADFGTRLLAAFQRSRSFSTFSLDTVPRAALHAARAEALQAAVRGELHAVVQDVLQLEAAAEAHRRMDAGSVFGRIVLVP